MDRKIAPGWGKNPFHEVIPPQQAGGYQIHFTRTGAFRRKLINPVGPRVPKASSTKRQLPPSPQK